jgi:ABC-2 type transport system permease protein
MVFLAFLSTTVIILVGIVVFGVSVHINIFMILTVVSASFAFSGMGMIVTRFVREEESADTAGSAITMPMMFLAGTFIPLEQMPEYLQIIAKFLPLYYVNEGLRDSMIFGDMNGAFVNTAIIGVLAVVFFVIGMFVTSWKED